MAEFGEDNLDGADRPKGNEQGQSPHGRKQRRGAYKEPTTERVFVGFDPFTDEELHEERVVPSTKTRRGERRHTRRFSGKARIIAATAVATVTIGGGVGIKTMTGGNETSRSPKVGIAATHEHSQPVKPVDPETGLLQQEFVNSTAELRTDAPFTFGLTQEDQQRLYTLQQHLNNNTLTNEEFRELASLTQTDSATRDEKRQTQEYIQKYNARFVGATQLKSGHKINIYQVASSSGKTFTVNPKALDAWEQWGIGQLNNVYEPDSSTTPTAADLDRRQKITDLQQKAKIGQLNSTITLLVNPDDNKCFTQEKDIVADNKQTCDALGFEQSFSQSDVVGLNKTNALDTRGTKQDPDVTNDFEWTKSSGPEDPTLAALLHETVGHVSAGEANLFPHVEGVKRDQDKDHQQLTIPLTNQVIRFLNKHASDPTSLPIPLKFP